MTASFDCPFPLVPTFEVVISDNAEGPQMAETRQFAAVHYFAMLDGRSNGETRPILLKKSAYWGTTR